VKHYDAVVVGCGAMGSAVTYHLAARGFKTLTLDRFHLGHDRGSSHGASRIIRMAYYEDARYVPLLRRAYELWASLEREAGTKLVELTGGLMVGPPGGELIPGVLRSARQHGLPYDVMSGREAGERYPQFRPDDDSMVFFERAAGVLFADRCIEAHVRLAREKGTEFRFDEGVTQWKPSGDGVKVVTAKGEYQADRVVAAAGPWTPALFRPGFRLACERQVPFWFRAREDERRNHLPAKMPVFIWEEPGRRYFYGIPDIGEGVKVAEHHGGRSVDPESVGREVEASDRAPVEDFAHRRLTGLEPEPSAWTTCLYTNTDDGNFVIDQHPEDGRVILVSACSGHGFKFSSVLGEVVSKMAGGERVPDAEFLRAARLTRRA
jgi:sarcosine oxidase